MNKNKKHVFLECSQAPIAAIYWGLDHRYSCNFQIMQIPGTKKIFWCLDRNACPTLQFKQHFTDQSFEAVSTTATDISAVSVKGKQMTLPEDVRVTSAKWSFNVFVVSSSIVS